MSMVPSEAVINKIIPLSVVDGPGCRTSVFVQGCNIACAYCHNPETQQLCSGCGLCVSQCPAGALSIQENGGETPKENKHDRVIWDESLCVQCDTCIRVCPSHASPKVRRMSAEDVWKEIEKNMPFIQGITVSGGECTLYPEFLTALFRRAGKAGLTCFLDSNGCVDLSQYPRLMQVTDQVMLDVKAWDHDVFGRLTGGDVSIVKKNLKYLAEHGKLFEVRLVCLDSEHEGEKRQEGVPEVDMEAVIAGVSREAAPYLKEFRLKLITFRQYGVTGSLKDAKSPSRERMEELKRLAVRYGFQDIQVV
ncbi:YjjW family glycine radical enzyme activase [Hungatella hathewayi 12489931]|uniref:YjjW family glycine radical enzyme activase n=1 Tax=Hungatella hathewayi TaxID=154046 RepID=UPI0002D1C68A|nr:YjjW family glycine radical enzyme activase [Hungatella hathewayi]ENY97595.1 YjjW family glycine radical enzyme activase [Hungatella hathewayi 12489931]